MHETTTKRPGRAGKYIRRALLALAAVILAAVLVLLALFQAELRTLNTIERVDDTDLFTMTYLETTAWTTFWPRAAPPTTTSCWTS